MKNILLGIILLSAIISADALIEVKDADGVSYTYVKTNKKPKLYVCYSKRVTILGDNGAFLKYVGCKRYRNSCRSNYKARFGKYPNVNSAKKALYRCRTSNPKFID